MRIPKKLHYTWVLSVAAIYWLLLYWSFGQWWLLALAAVCVGSLIIKRTALWYYDRPQWLCHVVQRKLLDDIRFAGFNPPQNEAILAERGSEKEFFQEGADVVSLVANLPDARIVASAKRFAELGTDYCCIWFHLRPSKFGLSNMEAHIWLHPQDWGRPETVRFGQIVEYCAPRAELNRLLDQGQIHIAGLYGETPPGVQNRRERAVSRFANAIPDYFTFR